MSRRPVVAGCDAPEVFQPVEGTFDAPAQLVEAPAEGERLFPVAAVWNDRIGSALIQLRAQFGAIVSLVANDAFRWLHPADQALRNRAIMRFASSQQDGEKPPFSICECVNLRVAPAARAANSLLLLPPFSARRRAVCLQVRGVDHLHVCDAPIRGKLPEQTFPDPA